MTAIDQDLLSIRFEIDHCTIFKVRKGQAFELVYQDTAIYSACASLNGAKEFSLHPKGKARLKVVSRMPTLDISSTHVMQQRFAVSWLDIVADFPMLPQRLVPHWAYKERFSYGHPHLASLNYQGNELDLDGGSKTHLERVVVVQHGKVVCDLSEASDFPAT